MQTLHMLPLITLLLLPISFSETAIFNSAMLGFAAFPVAWLCQQITFWEPWAPQLSLGSFSQPQPFGAFRDSLATRTFNRFHCFLSNPLQLLSWKEPEMPVPLLTRYSMTTAFVLLQTVPSAFHSFQLSSAMNSLVLIPKSPRGNEKQPTGWRALSEVCLHCKVKFGDQHLS